MDYDLRFVDEIITRYNITYNDMELRAAIEQAVKKMNAALENAE